MPFSNPVVGGAGALIRTAIKSPNYAAGAAGWTINRDGSAEFNNLTARGDLVVGTAPQFTKFLRGTDLPAELTAFYALQNVTLNVGELQYLDANTYRYTVLGTDNLGNVDVFGGWGILNNQTLAMFVWENYAASAPAIDNVGNKFAPDILFGFGDSNLTGASSSYGEEWNTDFVNPGNAAMLIYHNANPTGVIASEQSVNPTGFTLGAAFTVLPGSAITYQNPAATPACPYSWKFFAQFDISVTTAAAGIFAVGAVFLDGVKVSKNAIVDMQRLVRGTVTAVAQGTITNGNSHTWDMRAERTGVGGVAAIVAENTGLLVITQF